MKTSLAPLTLLALLAVACGDDTSSTGGGGGAGTTAATSGSTSSGTSTSTSTSGPTTSSSSGGGEGGSSTVSAGGAGQGGSGQGGSGQGGSGQGGSGQGGGAQGGGGQGGADVAPCAVECAGDDAACNQAPPDPSDACAVCVQEQAASQAACAIAAALGDTCQSDVDCADYVTCVLGGGDTCEADYPSGAILAAQLVLFECGACGDAGGGGQGGGGQGGGGQVSAPCESDCAADAGCDVVPIDPGLACASCVADEANAQNQCLIDALLGQSCQDDVECSSFVNCALSGDQDCDILYPEGYERARILTFYECGACGDGQF